MKKLLGVAAFAALSIGTAHAAPIITYTYNPLDPGAFTAVFSDTPSTTSFSDRFDTFTITTEGYFTGTIGSAGTTNNTFVNILVANLVGPITGPSGNTRTSWDVKTYNLGGAVVQLGGLNSVLLEPGTYRLFVKGTSSGANNVGSFSGNFNFIPVDIAVPLPEAGTWALMILGFAAVGAGMRRRSAQQRMRVAYS
jgi:hypothetical protein